MTRKSLNEHGLTPREESFCLARVEGLAPSDAYRKAAPDLKWSSATIKVKACEMSKLPQVRARIATLQAKSAEIAVLKAADIMEETRRIALSTPAGIIDRDTGKIKLPHELDAATAAAVSSFEIDDLGRVKYKFWDKNNALDRASKLLGMFKDKLEISGPNGGPIHVEKIEWVIVDPKSTKS